MIFKREQGYLQKRIRLSSKENKNLFKMRIKLFSNDKEKLDLGADVGGQPSACTQKVAKKSKKMTDFETPETRPRHGPRSGSTI